MKRTLLIGALVFPLVAAGIYSFLPRPARSTDGFRSGTFDPPREAPAFTLDGSNGKKLSLRDDLGKVVILEFGYASCEYVCPPTLARLTEVFKKLGTAARDVQLIYVTVDPARDTPEDLREYLGGFNPTFLGATGPPADVAAVLKAYGVVAEQVAAPNRSPGYQVNHSSFLYLVDRQGKIRTLVPFDTPADDIVHDVELLLKLKT